MKRFWIAIALLAAVLLGTLGHSFYIKVFSDDLTLLLEAAEARAEESDWAGAGELTQTAWEKWDDRDAYLHVTIRHDKTDAVYTGFREVSEFIQCRKDGEYSAANARLIASLTLMAEEEQLTLKNIL